MARVGFLYCVNRQCADGVNAKLVEFRCGVGFFLHSGAHDSLSFKFKVSSFKFFESWTFSFFATSRESFSRKGAKAQRRVATFHRADLGRPFFSEENDSVL